MYVHTLSLTCFSRCKIYLESWPLVVFSRYSDYPHPLCEFMLYCVLYLCVVCSYVHKGEFGAHPEKVWVFAPLSPTDAAEKYYINWLYRVILSPLNRLVHGGENMISTDRKKTFYNLQVKTFKILLIFFFYLKLFLYRVSTLRVCE